MLRPSTIRTLALGALLGVFGLAGCGPDAPTGPRTRPEEPTSRLRVHASLAGVPATGVVVEVSGPGIYKADRTTPDTLVFNLAVVAGSADGSIDVPAGAARVITVHVFDASVETHRGTTTIAVSEGSNATVNVTLVPLVGSVPITVSIGSTLVTVTPATASMNVGDTLRFFAAIMDADGHPVSGKVRWATLNPGRATVDTTGLVTARDTGNVQIVATYGTVGGSASIHGVPAAGTPVVYLRTWTGAIDGDWSKANNWSPAFVPTLTDSVVIPVTATSPYLTTNSSARDVEVKLGATLSNPYGYFLSVYGSAVAKGTFAANLYMRPSSRMRGTFGHVEVVGSNVSLDSATTATDFYVHDAGSDLRLNGKKLVVNNYLSLYSGGTITSAPGDSLVVSGNVDWNGGDETTKLTGGTVIMKGGYFNGTYFRASPAVRFIVQRTGRTDLYGFDYVYGDATRGILGRVELTADTVRVCSYMLAQDSMFVRGSTVVENTTCGGYYLQANGPLVTAPTSTVNMYLVSLAHPSGTKYVAGSWSPTYTDFNAVGDTINPALAYQNLRVYRSTSLTANVTATGQLYVGGSGTELVFGGHKASAGSMYVDYNAYIVMTNPADTADLLSTVNIQNGSIGHTSRITAGVIRARGDFNGNGYGSSGTAKVVLEGGGSVRHIYGMDFTDGSRANVFQKLDVTGSGVFLNCSHIRIADTLHVSGTVNFGNNGECGGYYMQVEKGLVVDATATAAVYYAFLYNPSGTRDVAGSWSPVYTDFDASSPAADAIKPGLSYQTVRIYNGGYLLSGDLTTTGNVEINNSSASLDLNAHKLFTPNFVENSGGTLRMTHAQDTLTTVNVYMNGGGDHTGKLTAGAIVVSSDFQGAAFRASGTHSVIFNAASTRINNVDYFSRPGQQFQNLIVRANSTVHMCAHTDVAGTLTLESNALISTQVSGGFGCGGGGYHLRTRGDIQAVSGSRVNVYYAHLANPTGTQNVYGTFDPIWTVIEALYTGSELKPGLGYSNIEMDVATNLSGDMTVNGSLQVNGSATNLSLNGHTLTVNGNLDLNSNGTITMTNPADSMYVAGQIFWDGGGSHSGKITAGTIVAAGDYTQWNNFYGSGTNRVIFTRASGGYTRVDANYSDGSRPFNDVIVNAPAGVKWNCDGYIARNLTVKSGASLYGCSSFVVKGVVTAEAGSVITNPPDGGNLSFIMDDSTGTRDIAGAYTPTYTYFRALNAHIKPGLGYNFTEIQRSTKFLARTVIGGQLNIVSSADVSLNNNTVEVNGPLNLDSPAHLVMTQPNDSMIVHGDNLYMDGGDETGYLTAGTVVFDGTYLYGSQYKALPRASGGTNKVVFNGNIGSPTQMISEGYYNDVEMRGSRGVQMTYTQHVQGNLDIVTPAPLTTTGNYNMWVSGDLSQVAGAGSTINLYGLVLYGSQGTKNVNGAYNVQNTYFYSSTPTFNAIKVGPTYTNIDIATGDYSLSGDMSIPGNLHLYSNGIFRTNSYDIAMGGNFEVSDGAKVMVGSPLASEVSYADSIGVGTYARWYSNAAKHSQLTRGVLSVRDVFQVDRDSAFDASNAFTVIADGTGGGTQYFYTYQGDAGGPSRNPSNVVVKGTRAVNFYYGVTLSGGLDVQTPVTVSLNNSTIYGAVNSVGFSTVSGGNVGFYDANGTNGIQGYLNITGTATFGSSIIKADPSMTYANIAIDGAASVTGSALSVGCDLIVYGNASLSLPNGTSVGCSYRVRGSLTFQGTATAGNELHVYSGTSYSASSSYPGGTVTSSSSGNSGGVYVDVTSIYIDGGATLDNTNGTFRRAPSGGYSASGTYIGTSSWASGPLTHP